MKNITHYIFILLACFTGCVDDDDSSVGARTQITPNEEELITTANLIFKDAAGMVVDTFSFSDLDGDGGNVPIIDTVKLNSNTNYTVSLTFLDESDPNDVEDITAEILAEDDEHLICFEPMNFTGLNISRTDSDGTYEVGLESSWTVGSPSISSNKIVRVTLKHQPDVKDGTCVVGDTDVEIDFPIVLR
ncbi:MAG: hypothetical protein JKY48_15370 [Flavobacteriales bacterium]|nr:hypothetical protein [Flavobacteriales bacterium]